MLANLKLILLVTIALVDENQPMKYLPILYWHSAGETCCGDEARLYQNFIKSHMNDDVHIKSAYVKNSIDLGDNINSYWVRPFNQIKQICEEIRNDPKFKRGYNAIGFSQGGLLIRGLAQECPYPPMKNLISFGGPQQGVHSYPRCHEAFGIFCETLQWFINQFAYSWLAQKVTPLTYWHGFDEKKYREGSTFLAILNNERSLNLDYKRNLAKLKRMILVKYVRDGVLVPNESAWFGFDREGGSEYPMEATDVYKNDKLGLQNLSSSGKLIRLLSPGDHIVLDPGWFSEKIIPYLKEV